MAAAQETFNENGDLEKIHIPHGAEDFLERYQHLRQLICQPDFGKDTLQAVLEDTGFDTARVLRDVLRLRIAPHMGFTNRHAKSAYSIHRDTWYANPSCQINFWVPLFDVRPTQGFNFYPAFFNKPVPNTSHLFDYSLWQDGGGFGKVKTKTLHTLYPTVTAEIPKDDACSFTCKAGDLVIFSAAQLHGNCQNLSHLTRYSIDFRVVHQDDIHKCLGAPNVDNHSKGSALCDYTSLIS